jgi:hypothetical protein
MRQTFPHDPLAYVLVEYDPRSDQVLCSAVSTVGGKTQMWCHEWRHVNACLNPHQPGRPGDPADMLAIAKCSQHLRSFSYDLVRNLMFLKKRSVLAEIGRSQKAEQVKWVRSSKPDSITAPSRPMPRGKQRHLIATGRTFTSKHDGAESTVKDNVMPKKTETQSITGSRVDIDSACVFLTEAKSGEDQAVFKKFTQAHQEEEHVFQKNTPVPKNEVSRPSEPTTLKDAVEQHRSMPGRGGENSAMLEANNNTLSPVGEEDVDNSPPIPSGPPAVGGTASTATIGGTASVLSDASFECPHPNIGVREQRDDGDAQAHSPEIDQQGCVSGRTSDHSSPPPSPPTNRTNTAVSSAIRSPRYSKSTAEPCARGDDKADKEPPDNGDFRKITGLASGLDRAATIYGSYKPKKQKGYENLNTQEELRHQLGGGKGIGFKVFMNPFDDPCTQLNHNDIVHWSARHGGLMHEQKEIGAKPHPLKTSYAGSSLETDGHHQTQPRVKKENDFTRASFHVPMLNTLKEWADVVELPHRRCPVSYSNVITAMGADVSFKKGLTMQETAILASNGDRNIILASNLVLTDSKLGAAATKLATKRAHELNYKEIKALEGSLPTFPLISSPLLPTLSSVSSVPVSGAETERKMEMEEDQQSAIHENYNMQNYGIRGKNIADKKPKEWRADPSKYRTQRLKMDGLNLGLAGLSVARPNETMDLAASKKRGADMVSSAADAAAHSEPHHKQQQTKMVADGTHAQAKGDDGFQHSSKRERASSIRTNAEGRYIDPLTLNNTYDFKIMGLAGFSSQDSKRNHASHVLSPIRRGSPRGRREGSPTFGGSGSPPDKLEGSYAKHTSKHPGDSTPRAIVTPRATVTSREAKFVVLNEREQAMNNMNQFVRPAPMTPREKTPRASLVVSLNLSGDTCNALQRLHSSLECSAGPPKPNERSAAPPQLSRLPNLFEPERVPFADAQVLSHLSVPDTFVCDLERPLMDSRMPRLFFSVLDQLLLCLSCQHADLFCQIAFCRFNRKKQTVMCVRLSQAASVRQNNQLSLRAVAEDSRHLRAQMSGERWQMSTKTI